MKPSNLERWGKILKDQKQSGKTQKEFCHENNLKLSTFHYWAKKIRKLNDDGNQNRQLKLVRVLPKEASQTNTTPIILETPENYRLILHPGFNSETVKNLLELL